MTLKIKKWRLVLAICLLPICMLFPMTGLSDTLTTILSIIWGWGIATVCKPITYVHKQEDIQTF